MSSDLAISIRGISKSFLIYHEKPHRTTMADALLSKLREVNAGAETFWALQDVSFDVPRGEALAIVGRNGAGKSTLLKILSRIMTPTRGEIDIEGRVGSLLEVGTGFHPELTGRENIFLNGAILGMRRQEIRRQFDSIVEFAEISKFLDTPVKRYSSGMYVRLAFAVAAHLSPDVLIVDEVLAVGDAKFQRKCLDKMREVATRDGRVVLFVSHNMGALGQICSRGILIDEGRVVNDAPIQEIVQGYLASGSGGAGEAILAEDVERQRQVKPAFFHRASLLSEGGMPVSEVPAREGFSVKMVYEVPQPISRLEISVRVTTAEGNPVFTALQSDALQEVFLNEQRGLFEAEAKFPALLLMPGEYALTLRAQLSGSQVYDQHDNVLPFTVTENGTSFAPYGNDHRYFGVVLHRADWVRRELDGPEVP